MLKWLVLVLMLVSATVQAQYYDERVLEKSFEQMDFYFEPVFVNPYGIDQFGAVAPGLIDDPLLNLRLNPAFAAFDSLTARYIYLNFRGSQEIKRESVAYPTYRPYDGIAVDSFYPLYYVNRRQNLEPVLSLAALSRPFAEHSSVTFGISYQAILQDEAYYEIPQDIYRGSVGTDFSGDSVANPSDIPIIDRFSGEDNIHHEGHFIGLLAAWALSQEVDLGLNFDRVIFNRDGSFGSRNFWQSHQDQMYQSLWYHMTGRRQDYDHWDLSLGLNVRPDDHLTVGVMGGHLDGEVSQTRYQDNISNYQDGTVGQGSSWSYYDWGSGIDQTWRHDGHSDYGSVNLQARFNSAQTLNIYYRYTRNATDILLGSSIADTSSGSYYNEYNQQSYQSESTSALRDFRAGTGQQTINRHVLAAALQWQIDARTRIHLGANFSYREQRTNTIESVHGVRHSEHEWLYPNYEGYYNYAVEEQKDLIWDFDASETAFHLPIILDSQVSPNVALQFGLDRSMRRWKVDDVTLALFDYRTETVNGSTQQEENFGERYTLPEEKRSDVKTMFLAGLTIDPSEHLQVRVLLVPNFKQTWDGTELSDLQWWIDIRLF